MLAIIDARSSEQAKENIKKYADEVLYFETDGITYNSISGHPDIFMYQDDNNLIIAPNSPELLFNFLKKHTIKFQIGRNHINETVTNSVRYNCVSTDSMLLHKKDMTEDSILETNFKKTFINLPQAYARCSMIHLGNDVFVTSDLGIKKELDKHKLQNFYFSPEDIQIIDHKTGFFGGTCGVYNKKIVFNGTIDKHKSGKDLRAFLTKLNFEIITLSDDFLYDGGGIFFIDA